MTIVKASMGIVLAMATLGQVAMADMVFKQPLVGLKPIPSTGGAESSQPETDTGTGSGGSSGETTTPEEPAATDTTADANGNLSAYYPTEYVSMNNVDQYTFNLLASGVDSDQSSVVAYATDGNITIQKAMSSTSENVNGSGDYSDSWSTGSFSLAALSDGAISGYVEVTDAEGNTATAPFSGITKDTQVTATVTLDPLTANGDNYVSLEEQAGDIDVTGTVTGEGADGATVLIRLRGIDYTGTTSGGAYKVTVPGSSFANDSDLVLDYIIILEDPAGNTDVETGTQAYTIEYGVS